MTQQICLRRTWCSSMIQHSKMHLMTYLITSQPRCLPGMCLGGDSSENWVKVQLKSPTQLSRSSGNKHQFDYMINSDPTDQVISGNTHHLNWHYNHVLQWWDGNPVTSGDVWDIMKSIKNKLSADGVDHEHSSVMKKENMDKILAWAMLDCPEIRNVLHFIYIVLTKTPILDVHISDDVRKKVMRHFEFLAFASTVWIIWTRYSNDDPLICLGLPCLSRCCELMKLKRRDIQMDNAQLDSILVKYMRGEQDALTISNMDECCEIHLWHRKGWQRKEDKSFKEIDLHGMRWDFDSPMLLYPNLTAANHYQIFPRPDLTSCDVFFWLLTWIRWVEYVHLGCPMADEDFVFPAVGWMGSSNLVNCWHQIASKKCWTKQRLAAVLKVNTQHTVFAGEGRSIGSYAYLKKRNCLWMWYNFGVDGQKVNRSDSFPFLLNQLFDGFFSWHSTWL